MRGKRGLASLICLLLAVFSQPACSEPVKEPAVAGSFYPADPQALREAVRGYLGRAAYAPVEGRLIALITPHAGYMYSAQVAAHTYRHLKERDVRTVVLIGASHTMAYSGVAVLAKGGMRTPLGTVKIDEKAARSLLDEKAGVRIDPKPFEKEHSLEVQLPFLQETLQDFRVVPLLTGTMNREAFSSLLGKLTGMLAKDERAILIASTDLSHYHDYDTAVGMDRKLIDAILRMAPDEAERLISARTCEMCGAYPVILTMAVAQQLGATNGVLYHYANSGDATGERQRVVGYAAIGLYRSGLSQAERDTLLSLARKTVEQYVTDGTVPEFATDNPRLSANGATFVTINRHGMLRGCIGTTMPVMPLYRSVIQNAVSAATRDPRFPPMTKNELNDIEVEVSVLSPFQPVTDVKNIEVGRHGLYLVKGSSAGLLLPQVPGQFGWDRETFLEQISVKAGLPKDAWKDAQLYTFTAEIIR